MNVTDIRLTVIDDEGKFRAACDMVFDDQLIVHGVKLIATADKQFISFPSKPANRKCWCGGMNHFRAAFCNFCGKQLEQLSIEMKNGRQSMRCPFCSGTGCMNCYCGYTDRLYNEDVHPLNGELRHEVTQMVIREYQRQK